MIHIFFFFIISIQKNKTKSNSFFSSTGRRPASYGNGIVSTVRPSVGLFVRTYLQDGPS